MAGIKELIREYRESLRKLRKSKAVPLYRSSMISDTEWTIKYMETGRIPGTKWTVARWSRKDREVLFDPQVMARCFRIPDTTPEVSEGIRLMLENLLMCLSKRERDVFLLVIGQRFTHSQAAEFLGLSRDNVYNLLKRAEKKFSIYREFVGQKQVKDEEVC